MKYNIFVINLKSDVDRRLNIERQLKRLKLNYELIDAVDGKYLERDATINWEWADKNSFWVSKGALACSLSHLIACSKIIEQKLDFGLILEDDTILSDDLPSIINKIGGYLKDKEVIMLYYASWNSCILSKHNNEKLSDKPEYYLLYPKKGVEIVTANAYILNGQTCESIIKYQTPIQATADSWKDYIDSGVISNLRCVYPFIANSGDFKSSIDYISNDRWRGILLNFIDKYKIPIIYQFLKFRRRLIRKKMLKIELTELE